MAYIILSSHDEEFDRRELHGPTVIGRSAECTVAVRDILLSRMHCRLEPAESDGKECWRLVDLGSRNGSHVNWKAVSSHMLGDRDKVRVGRSWIEFHQGPFEPLPENQTAPKKSKLVRPADPHEALAGTISDFVYVEPENDGQEFDATPSPMPHAEEPAGATTLYNPNALHDLSESVSGISVMAPPKARRLAAPVRISLPRRVAQSFHADLSLQADAQQVPLLQSTASPKALRIGRVATAVLLACGIVIATLMVLASAWIIANG
jgi:pSer/pThr/pTyr-binding forkhead associated (FHA) protein